MGSNYHEYNLLKNKQRGRIIELGPLDALHDEMKTPCEGTVIHIEGAGTAYKPFHDRLEVEVFNPGYAYVWMKVDGITAKPDFVYADDWDSKHKAICFGQAIVEKL